MASEPKKQMEAFTYEQYALFDQARKQQKQRQADNEDLKILENWQKEIKQLKDKR